LFVDIARAHTEDEVARLEHVADVAMDPFQSRLIRNAAVTGRRDFIRNQLSANSRNRGFVRSINVGYHHPVRIAEGAAKLFPEQLGPRITMGLEHGQDTFAPNRSRRS